MKPKPDPKAGTARRRLFDEWHERYRREVWALAYARWMDSDSALDITQETFLRLWKLMEAGEEIQNTRAWLLRVARNLAEDYSKSAFRRNGTQPPELLNGLTGKGIQPLDSMERDETFARIRGVLDELATGDREILTLRYALEYEAPQIAETLGIAVSAVHMRLSRARQRLAEKLSLLGVTQLP